MSAFLLYYNDPSCNAGVRGSDHGVLCWAEPVLGKLRTGGTELRGRGL